MPTTPIPDIDLAARLFEALREKTFDGVGVTRDAYGPGEQAAHDLMTATGEGLGLEVQTDPAGNLYLTFPGRDRGAKRIILGSHLDSVPHGGNYDGAAGVLAGMAAVAGMMRARFTPERDVTVMAIRAEEAGAWFPVSYPGSNAALGRLPPEHLDIRRLDTGRTLAEHMRALGFDPDWVRAGKAWLTPSNTGAYLELHIEQGPVLDAEGLPVAIVTGIPSSRRLRSARVIGEYNHSGATPRRYRQDAAMALAELATGLDDHWARLETQGHQLVCTFCVLATTEAAGFTKIPGEAVFQLDVRSVQRENVDAIFTELARLVPAIEARRGVRFELGSESSSTASLMDADIQRRLVQAAESLRVPYRVMPSGGGHDAAAFAQAGVPAGMLFVRNQNGSHNPHEAMRTEDFAAGCAVVTQWAAEMAA
ncbi:MAG: hydantoinase/carbamoylase family amidase [Acetobacteraceae bacterium]|nr:hydantoinase/carbamoylase family amidase [Acetobacteraceae bacterium]